MKSAGLSRSIAAVLLALMLAAVSGCATTAAAPGATPGQRLDPWENWNRKVFAFNERLDTKLLKPVATAYSNVVPGLVRAGIGNFFGNFSDAWSAVNNLLQGKLESAARDVFRVGTNTAFGLFGVLDVASDLGLERSSEDLGQTFGHWGMSPGAYIVWPVLGPSTLRESVALPFDRWLSSPAVLIDGGVSQTAVTTLQLVSTRASLLAAGRLIDDIALDKYTFLRDAYLQRRRSLVYDGNVPEEPEPALPAGSDAPAPESAASAPAK